MAVDGFWSYARDDDTNLEKALSNLRYRIARRVSAVTGQDVSLFQDISDIRTGDNWRRVLQEKLSAASFLMPIITPRFLNSTWCRDEVEGFCQAARAGGLEPVLFPIYYIRDRRFDEPSTASSDALIKQLREFQYFDFRELQFETDDRIVEREIHKLAEAIESRLYEAAAMAAPAGATGPAEVLPRGIEREWQGGDIRPRNVRFVGYPDSRGMFAVGNFVEGQVYEVTDFDGVGESPFNVEDGDGLGLWVDKRGFRVVD